jgi:hypothetical protein
MAITVRLTLAPLIGLAALCLASGVQAQVYKCKIDGKTVFSDQPCAADAKPMDVRPAAGRADSGASSFQPSAAPINASSNPQALVERMERDRERRALEHQINDRRSQINAEQAAMDRDLGALRQQKQRANNNLAGATWEKSISEEMNAVVARYDVRIRALQDEIKRMEADLAGLGK